MAKDRAAGVEVHLERPRDAGHGDLATNVAFQLAKPLKKKPREVAQAIVDALDAPDLVAGTEIAGPGFINFWLAEEVLFQVLIEILEQGEAYGTTAPSAQRRAQRINVEFVSANPTGPLHVGHGRGAALGDAVARLLEAVGHEVTREFYVNDAGVQIDKLAQSVWARVQQAVGREAQVPEGGYHGQYVTELARDILRTEGTAFANLPEPEGLERCRAIAMGHERDEQNEDLRRFGVTFDVFYDESSLYADHEIDETLAELESKGLTYEQDGALWLRTSEFGDDKDRVLRKSDGTYTYFLPDLAYHRNKARRGFDRAIDVWGADHHGYVPRMTAALKALGLPDGFFHAEIVQLVRVMRHGEEVRFSKRTGEFVTLRDLYEEVGVDAARYFFLMRKADAQFVFDVDLALKQSEENPVYYVQYAHTRMAGIFRNAAMAPEGMGAGLARRAQLGLLSAPEEQALIKHLAYHPEVVDKAAAALEPHRVIYYLEELAKLVNQWYHEQRVLGVEERLTQARLVLARAAQIVLANGLGLLGVSAPERM